jgi:hypothetical protein
MPRRGAVLNEAAVPVPVRPVPDMSVLPYAAVRRMACHTWFHDPVFPFVHLADLGPRRPAGARRGTPATTPGVSGSRPACAGAAGHAPTIRLAARPNLGRLSRAHHIGGFGFPPPRRRNCARPGLSGACGVARDSQRGGAALCPGAGHPPAPLSHLRRVMTGLRRSPEIELSSGRCDIGAGGEWTSALGRRLKPGAGRPPTRDSPLAGRTGTGVLVVRLRPGRRVSSIARHRAVGR